MGVLEFKKRGMPCAHVMLCADEFDAPTLAGV